MTKKHITYTVLALLAVTVTVTAGTLVLRSTIKQTPEVNTNINDSQNAVKTEAEAEISISSGKKARQAGDYTSAIASYQKARAYYENARNSEKTADIDLAISLLQSEKKNMPAPVETKPVGVQ